LSIEVWARSYVPVSSRLKSSADEGVAAKVTFRPAAANRLPSSAA
jgi:hypothetical protein